MVDIVALVEYISYHKWMVEITFAYMADFVEFWQADYQPAHISYWDGSVIGLASGYMEQGM